MSAPSARDRPDQCLLLPPRVRRPSLVPPMLMLSDTNQSRMGSWRKRLRSGVRHGSQLFVPSENPLRRIPPAPRRSVAMWIAVVVLSKTYGPSGGRWGVSWWYGRARLGNNLGSRRVGFMTNPCPAPLLRYGNRRQSQASVEGFILCISRGRPGRPLSSELRWSDWARAPGVKLFTSRCDRHPSLCGVPGGPSVT
jgi:hypothetical protein